MGEPVHSVIKTLLRLGLRGRQSWEGWSVSLYEAGEQKSMCVRTPHWDEPWWAGMCKTAMKVKKRGQEKKWQKPQITERMFQAEA